MVHECLSEPYSKIHNYKRIQLEDIYCPYEGICHYKPLNDRLENMTCISGNFKLQLDIQTFVYNFSGTRAMHKAKDTPF